MYPPRPPASRPIVHVGLHKTATTWFQRRYFPRLTSHRYVEGRVVRGALLGGGAFGFDAAAARAALGFDLPGPPPLISEEDLSGVLHNGGALSSFLAAGLAERVHAVAPEAMIVIFAREQVAAAAAHYNQYVREGGTHGARRYLFSEHGRDLAKGRVYKTPRFDWSQLDAAGLVGRYDDLFGAANVHVFAYEAFARDRAGFLRAFEARLGLAGPPAPEERARVNGSLRRGLLPVARAMNLFTARQVADKHMLLHVPYWYGLRKKLLAAMNRSPVWGAPRQADALLGAEIARWVRAEFAEPNARLARRMGVDLGALGYAVEGTEPAPRPGPPGWRRALRS